MPRFHLRLLRRALTAFPLFLLPLGALGALDSDLLSGLEARALGPAAVSGRVTAIDAVHDNPNHIVIGTASGGVWISQNGGLNWSPVFDDQPYASIGAVAINQRNPDIIWVGTGEGNVRNSVSIGGGMFKSVDGGRTWQRAGLEGTERINRIALHPENPQIAYAAALGTLWGENSERGIFKTRDGGATWERILHADEKTGGTDVKLDPFNPEKVYASLWQHRRWPYRFESGGPGSGLYISWDGGRNWSRKTVDDGLPEGDLGRITFAPSPARPGRIYALVEAAKSALVRSDDGGESWIRVNESHDIMSRPFYYTEIAADPENPERVYNIFENLGISIDGGRTFENNARVVCCAPGNTIHIDNHALWINPGDANHLILGNDGGLAITRDQGETWRFVRNLPLSQFYHVAVDDEDPYHIYGGLQDNGSWRGPSEVWENGGIRNLHWQEVSFGDGFDTRPDPENPRQGYAMFQGGMLARWNLDTGELRLIRPNPPADGTELRFNWNAALAQVPFDSATIYYGSQFVHKSTDRGASWQIISPDLTSNDPDLQTFRDSGGLTPDVTAAENYTTLVAIAPSPLERGTLWTGSDDGRVHVTRDGGETWVRIDQRARGFEPGAWVPMITPSPHDAGTAFVVFDDHRRSDMQPHVFRVEDYGRRWTSLVTPELRGYALSILQDPVDPELLFVGTELGLFVSTDGGSGWTPFRSGVPTVSVMDMAIQRRESDLVLGTHGRSIFVIDDYSALRGLDSGDFKQRLAILSTTPGQEYISRQTPSTRFTGSGEFRAPNEPYGVLVTFLASGNDLPHPDPDAERQRKSARRASTDAVDESDTPPRVQVRVTDADGTVVRRFTRPVHQGLNRLNWDLSHDGVRPMPGPNPPEPDADLPSGPDVPPGTYRLTLSLEAADGETAESTADVTVVPDPRHGYDAAAREANYRARLALQELEETAVTAVERIVRAGEDLDTVKRLIRRHPDAESERLASLEERAGELQGRLDELEKRFRVPPQTRGNVYDDDRVVNRIGTAQFYVGSTLDAPAPASQDYVELARQTLDDGLSRLNALLGGEITDFRSEVESAGIALLSAAQPVAAGGG
ncbi:WD40/YVTN/BNR-like repeat-containing protein [Elongatibacter sediminis]|uniref:Sortilin N-terminal domain-containing protein n=1 Tax=Elongatibacter sediminis TaxID=3119006 RepID=A0AAW9RD61_9GAMM